MTIPPIAGETGSGGAGKLCVLHLLPHVLRVGNGIVDVTVDLALAQASAGHDVHVISSGGEYEELLGRHGVTCHRARLHPRDWTALRGTVRDLRPDIVHAHTLKGTVLAQSVAPRTPLVATVHRDPGHFAVALNVARRVIAVSEGNRVGIQQSIRGDKVRVVTNGVVGSIRRAEQVATTVSLRRPSVVFVGGLYDRKGVEPLLRAFRKVCSDYMAGRRQYPKLYIIGEGPRRAWLEALSRGLDLVDRVQFLGYRDDANAYIRACDLFVLPSLDEPFGLVVAEAREAGVAIVGSDVGGIPQVLEHGRAGVLVPAGDVAALAVAIRNLLADDDLRQGYRYAARENLEWLSVERMYEETMNVYLEVAGP